MSNWSNFWQTFASRGFVSDSWAFVLLPEMWLLRGPRKKISRLAIARHIFRPPHKLCYNSTTVECWCLDYRIIICNKIGCILEQLGGSGPNTEGGERAGCCSIKLRFKQLLECSTPKYSIAAALLTNILHCNRYSWQVESVNKSYYWIKYRKADLQLGFRVCCICADID